MRIIAGQWRGRKLKAPPGDTTRPTADRTRETLFSMLASRLGSFEELRVLDLFAGSGALGLEALSRGAGHCQFVELDRKAIAAIEANVETLGARERSTISNQSAIALGPARAPFDLVLMDPPYGTGAGGVALDKLGRLGWFAPSAWIAIETDRGETIETDKFAVDAVRDVGKARLTLMRPLLDADAAPTGPPG